MSHATTDTGGSPTFTRFGTLAERLRRGDLAALQLQPGTRIQNFEVLGLLGEGGMSRVYEARHAHLRYEVAIKVPRATSDERAKEVAERYFQEAGALAALNHPHVIRVLDAGVHEDIPYVMTERLRGASLADTLKRIGPLQQDRVLDLLEEIGQVLLAQEALGLLHRDIKPHNLFVRPDGSFCLFDYGLVAVHGRNQGGAGRLALTERTVTQAGVAVGTPAYMAPEQMEGSPLDQRTDLFALGMTAWEALAGRPAREQALQHVRGGPRLPEEQRARVASTWSPVRSLASMSERIPAIEQECAGVSKGLGTLLGGLLEPRPEDRYPSAMEFLKQLESFRYGGRPPSAPFRGTVFVAMPFRPDFDAVFDAIRAACAELRLDARRTDRLPYVPDIWKQILQEMQWARLVIADFSSVDAQGQPNANVVTEATYCRVHERPLLLIGQQGTQCLPFDWRYVPIMGYEATATGLRSLQRELASRLAHAVAR